MDYSSYYQRIESARQKIAELQAERIDLDGFYGEVNQGAQGFAEQLERKRTAAQRMKGLGSSRLAQALARSLLGAMGNPFQSRIEDDFAGIKRDIDRAKGDIDREIAAQKALIVSIEDEIARLQAEERARQAAEEAARTAAQKQ